MKPDAEASDSNAEKIDSSKVSIWQDYLNMSTYILLFCQTAPAGLAAVDDQRNLEICTFMSLGKCLANGFMTKKFVNGKEVDIDQQSVTTVLTNIVKV